MSILSDSREQEETEPVWVLVANVISARPWRDPNTGILHWRPGTKHFSGGTKVYCERPMGGWDLEYGRLFTLGRARSSGRWISVVTAVSSLESFRVKKEYSPSVLKRLPNKIWIPESGTTEKHRATLESMAEQGNRVAGEMAERIEHLKAEATTED